MHQAHSAAKTPHPQPAAQLSLRYAVQPHGLFWKAPEALEAGSGYGCTAYRKDSWAAG